MSNKALINIRIGIYRKKKNMRIGEDPDIKKKK